MLNVNSEKFLRLTRNIQWLHGYLAESKEGDTLTVNKDLQEEADEIVELLTEMRLPVSLAQAKRMRGSLTGSKTSIVAHRQLIADLAERIKDELALKSLFLLTEQESTIFIQIDPLFGQEVTTAFPSSAYDITECGKCYALGRSTASVMHAMRSLEPAFTAMGKELGIVLKRDNWGDALQNFEKAILALTDKDKKEFLSEAAVQFRFFKDAWRNHAMHARSKYTEEEAQIVMTSAKAFMRQLTKRLKE
jgi:hypothetical protein